MKITDANALAQLNAQGEEHLGRCTRLAEIALQADGTPVPPLDHAAHNGGVLAIQSVLSAISATRGVEASIDVIGEALGVSIAQVKHEPSRASLLVRFGAAFRRGGFLREADDLEAGRHRRDCAGEA